MKTVMVVGVSILVGFLCLQANASKDTALQVPGPDGKIAPCKELSADIKSKCVKYWCDEATGAVTVLGCSLYGILCAEGSIYEEGSEDLNKTYPDCCPQHTCRTA